MIETLWQLDTKLFIFINHLPHNVFFDTLFGFFSGIGYAGIVWFALGIGIFVWEEIKDKKTLIALIFGGLFSLIVGELGIKNFVRRLRPQFDIPSTVSPFSLPSTFSFPSFHTTIAFAAAYILSKKHKKIAWAYYLLAILISFSRIYLGKHYPSDVLGGILFGLAIGYMSLKVVSGKIK